MRRVFLSRVRSRVLGVPQVPAVGIMGAPKESSAVTSSDVTAQHGVGVEGVDGVAGPRGVSSRLTHSAPSHHTVAQVALNKTPGFITKGDQPAANVALVSTSNESCDHHSSIEGMSVSSSCVTEQRGNRMLSSHSVTSLFTRVLQRPKRITFVVPFLLSMLLTPAVAFAGVLA